MIDPDIHNLLRYTEARVAQVGHHPEMPELAARLGYTCEPGAMSRLERSGRVIYQADLSESERRADIAHELGHGLMREGQYTNFEEVLRHRHASAPDIDQHIEIMADLQGDLLLMPGEDVASVLAISGYNARAVWVLHQHMRVRLREALRRIVLYDFDRRCAGFVVQGRRITEATSHRCYLPFWRGSRLAEGVLEEFENAGGSLMPVPGYPSQVIGLIVVEE